MRYLVASFLSMSITILLSSPAIAYEEPRYAVLAVVNTVEYRQYEPYLVAETFVSGESERSEATSVGFRRLFDYISGANAKQTEIPMTAPVQQQISGVEIDMTAPVQQASVDGGWIVSFIVPDQYSEADVPQPINSDIYIRAVPRQLVAVLRYSGRWSDENVSNHKSQLLSAVAAADVEILGEVVAAFYNAPFSIPFMRRNEVMVAIGGMPVVGPGDTHRLAPST